MSFWIELKRRNVVKVGLAYAVVAWLLIQMVTTVMPTFDAPEWVAQTVTFLLVLLLPFVLVFAWVFELTPGGLKKTDDVPAEQSITQATSQRLSYVIAALLVVAIAFMGVDRYFLATPIASEEAVATVGPPTAEPGGAADAQTLPNSVAVIPFANLSPRAEDGYFAAGIHEEILNQLVKLQNLNVIARTSVLQYVGTSKTIQEIGRELNVETVMEGSVRYADGRVLVTTQLIDARTNVHRWSDSYEREFANIFAIQADIAMNVANALQAEFTPAEQASIEQRPTKSLEAYESYLAAQDHTRERNAYEGSRSALESLDAALALDPTFARAWAMKAALSAAIAQTLPASRFAEAQQNILDAATRAVELDPTLIEGQATLAAAHSRSGDWLEAEADFRRAYQAGATATARLYGIHLHAAGNTAKAHELVSIERRTDPRNQLTRGFYILGIALLGDSQRSDEEFARAKTEFPDVWIGNWFVSLARLRLGEPTTVDRIPRWATPTHNAAREHLGSPAAGLAMLRDTYAAADDPQISTLLEIGLWSAYFGDPELALAALERATRLNAQNALQFWLPSMREVRQLPRFKEFMREIGLVDYWRQFGYPMLCRPAGANDFECG